ncbi:MAG: inorganic diphosphatase [Allomuricauda sp.]
MAKISYSMYLTSIGMEKAKHNIGFLFLLLCLLQCTSKPDVYDIPAFSSNNVVNCIIEIPAGTNKKIEFNKETKKFEIDRKHGQERVINFLSYPGNYGFIPSTYSNPKKGGDGDALDVIVLSESSETGTVMEVLPIAIFKLLDNGEQDNKIVCIPLEENLRTINAPTFDQLKLNYPKVITILETWFLNYDIKDVLQSKGWGDEKEAYFEIRKSLKKH